MVNWSGSAVRYSASRNGFQTCIISYTGGSTPGIAYPCTGTNFEASVKALIRKMPPKGFTALDG